MNTPPIWSPSPKRVEQSEAQRFIKSLAVKSSIILNSWEDLYEWSIREPDQFWLELLEYFKIQVSGSRNPVIENRDSIEHCSWFPNLRLNFAKALLYPPTLGSDEDKKAVVFYGEDKKRRELSFTELRRQTYYLVRFFRNAGISKGDRIAALMPNSPETAIVMLAAATIGATFSSCSPAFGAASIIDRFAQIEPKILVVPDGYEYGGKTYLMKDRVNELLPCLPSLSHVIHVPHLTYLHPHSSPVEKGIPPQSDESILNSSDNGGLQEHLIRWDSIVSPEPYKEINAEERLLLEFEELPFNHPLYIMFSSGTTGKPKCIVHGTGGTLLEHLKELVLHTDIKKSDTIFYQTNCGWMMWNWLVSALGTGATVVLYDGSPLLNDGQVLFDIADQEGITVFGTNPKYLSLIEKNGLKPTTTSNLSALKTVLSTGSPLLPENFEYVYNSIKGDVCLSSITGGTDIIGCFALGSPMLPVYAGELQTRSLGYKVEVYNSSGESVIGEKGELVCTAPFPSMPIYFWNDNNHSRRIKSYFERFPSVWHHGDYVSITKHGGMIFYGRSDAVLNPGGVRIGTAEIYRQVETLPEMLDCMAVGQEWKGDSRVILFVKLQDGLRLDEEIISRIKTRLRTNASPFHVPSKIIQVSDIPRTRSGKIVELTVTALINGLEPENIDALANPECLSEYRQIPALQED